MITFNNLPEALFVAEKIDPKLVDYIKSIPNGDKLVLISFEIINLERAEMINLIKIPNGQKFEGPYVLVRSKIKCFDFQGRNEH